MNLLHIARRGLSTGLALTVSTTAVLLVASDIDAGNPWKAINNVAHIIDGDEKEQPSEFALRESALGLGINATAMIAWGLLYEGGLSVVRWKPSIWTAVPFTLFAWLVDYRLVPKQYTPGIERALRPRSIFVSYCVLAATLMGSSLWNRPVL